MNNLFEVMNGNRIHTHNTKRIELNSGLTLSIQASEYHYCEPRMHCESYEEYRAFEVGFPSEKIDSIIQYAEDENHPTETVYGYVPVEMILEIVESNGGIKGVKS